MDKKDWRQTKWKDYTREQKAAFIIMAVLLAILLVMALIYKIVHIPDWSVVLVVVLSVLSLHKSSRLFPHIFNMDVQDEIEDEEEPDDD